MSDRTPDGQEIHTATLWLDDGSALSIDYTGYEHIDVPAMLETVDTAAAAPYARELQLIRSVPSVVRGLLDEGDDTAP